MANGPIFPLISSPNLAKIGESCSYQIRQIIVNFSFIVISYKQTLMQYALFDYFTGSFQLFLKHFLPVSCFLNIARQFTHSHSATLPKTIHIPFKVSGNLSDNDNLMLIID